MTNKRRDNKGRVLRNGEFQRSNGCYEYKYVNSKGERKSVYSWKLVETDILPPGKRAKPALRTLIKQIQQDIDDGLLIDSNITLNDFFDYYLKTKKDIKNTSVANIKVCYKYLEIPIGHMPISKVTHNVIRKNLIDLLYEKHLKYSSVKTIKKTLNPMFVLAEKEKLIRENPFKDVLKSIKNTDLNAKKIPKVLTEEQELALISFVENTPKFSFWADLIVFLLGTGCRIGEAISLRWCDCDFENNLIDINHNLLYVKSRDGNKVRYEITTPKTTTSNRIIPMLNTVKDALLNVAKYCEEYGFNNQKIENYSGFIFRNKCTPTILSQSSFRRILRSISQEFNSSNTDLQLPILTPHMFRHTFCTRLCEKNMNIKIIQQVMGHSSIGITMDVYTNMTDNKVIEAFNKLEKNVNLL